MANQVTLTFAGDSKSLERTFEKVGAGAKDMARDFDKAGADAKKFGSAMDRAADATDKSEGKFMGAADLLDGLGGAFGLPTEGATNMMRSFGDLSGGFSAIGPMIGKMGGALSGLAMGPVGLIIAGVAALTVGIIALYKNSETFRDIVQAAFNAVKAVLGPIIDGIGKAIGWVTGLFGENKDKVEELGGAYETMAEDLRASLEQQRASWQSWRDRTTALIDDIHNPLERAREKSTVTFADIAKNLADNVKFFDGWIANLNVLMGRGFGELAQKMFELGPTAEKAVGEMVGKSDAELTRMTNLFGQAGTASQRSFMSPFMTNESLRAIDGVGVQYGVTFKKGFDAGLTGPISIPMHRVGPAVPHMAAGGIVNRPTLAMIGEAGPEAVVPLSGGGGVGGVHINAGVIVTENQLADLVHKALLRKQNRGGSLGFS